MLLYTAVSAPYNQQPDPQNPGVYTEDYDLVDYDYSLVTKLVTATPYTIAYVGGYSGAPAPPSEYVKPAAQLVDRYTVPSDPAAPGYDAAAIGLDRRVYHDEPANLGTVRYEDQAVCDLELASLTPSAPTTAGGTGQIVVGWSTSSTLPVAYSSIGLITRTGPDLGAVNGLISGLPPGTYEVTIGVGEPVGCSATGTVTVPGISVAGCPDEYATNYNPDATQPDPNACTYAPRWRSVWGPEAVAERVAAVANQATAYISAELRIGFRSGHPLADSRPLGEPLQLNATVGPDGFATFRLGPYLRSALGADDGSGGFRLDLNSTEAFASDLFTGYELRRPEADGGQLLAHGYGLNAAVPDEQLDALTPFPARLPVWPGFDDYLVAQLSDVSAGRYGIVANDHAYQFTTVRLACPTNPVPVAWLVPGAGYGYWVFSGRPALGDDIGESQAFTEATTGERRWSQRGEARKTVQATSGAFKGLDLLEGLRTLWASPQVWYQPVPGGAWVPVTIEGGSFPAGRLGIVRQNIPISFTEAKPRYAQGQ